MSHLDEGTLHALLDGELELDEVREIQQHLGSCAACGARLQDVKQFLAEADRLVGALEVPAGKHAETEGREPHHDQPSNGPSEPRFREPSSWDTEEPPVLLLPESPTGEARHRRWMQALRLAAMIVVVVIGGRLVSNALRPGKPVLEITEQKQATAGATPPAVVSQQEQTRPAAPGPAVASKLSRPTPAPKPPAAKLSAEPKALADKAVVDSVPALSDSGQPIDSTAVASADTTSPGDTGAANGVVVAAVPAEGEPGQRADEQSRRDADLETRRAASAALAELDRQRVRERANAATAALPPARAEVAADAPPPPRTLEQRAQIYLRIGLDEAVRQLGQPVHVIEAMSPEFIGLTQGRNVPGADAGRPVVRVVYVDSRGRMILLDQQRLRSGQAAGASGGGGSLRWTMGDVMLYLHGEPGPDVLTNLQKRVR